MPRFGPPREVYTGQKHKFKDTWGKLAGYCKPNMVGIVIALVCAVIGVVFTLLGPNKISAMTDTISEGIMSGINLSKIRSIAFTLVAFYSCSLILSYAQGYIMAVVTQRITKRLRKDISIKINDLPLKYFDTTSTGDILSRVTNDVDTIGQTLNQSIASLVSAVVQFLGAILMMFITNWILALVAIGSSLIGFVIMIIIISRSQKYFVAQQKELGKLNGHIEEVYAGHNVVKAYNAEEKLNKDYETINKKLYNSSWHAQFLSNMMMPLMGFIGNFGYLAVCVVGATLALNGTIGIGTIVAFMVYVRLFTNPLSQIAQSMSSLQSTGAASYRVFEFLEQQELSSEDNVTDKLDKIDGNIEFKNVKFGYDENKIIIKDFSAQIKSGQKVAIVGPTGAGKTTMVNLLMRFYETNSGDILIDNKPIKTITRENVHELFCMVLQDTWLFEGTIKENIIYNKQHITDEQVVSACKAVGIDHFINTLPDGYNTILNEEASLSNGQRQLITIARAMVSNAPMLILDEATSSVDTRTEILIQKAMDKLMKGRTSIIIAHRLSTIKNADLILVMKNGDIIESGNHTQLLQANGFYADLYNSQFDKL